MTPKNEPRKWYAKFPGEPEPEPAAEVCRHGDDPKVCISCEMLRKRPDKAEPESEPVAPRELAEAFPVGVFLQEEMDARRWTTEHVAALMGGDPQVNQLTLELILAAPHPEMRLAQETAEGLSRAFGVSAEMFMNLDKSYHEWMRQPESTPRPEPSSPSVGAQELLERVRLWRNTFCGRWNDEQVAMFAEQIKSEALAPTQPRCLITGNPCGTDTRPVGQPCPCANCKAEVIQPQPSAEETVIGQLMESQGLSREGVLRQALRTYQLVATGHAQLITEIWGKKAEPEPSSPSVAQEFDDEHELLDSLGIPSTEPDGMGGSVFLCLESRIKLLAERSSSPAEELARRIAEARVQGMEEARKIAQEFTDETGDIGLDDTSEFDRGWLRASQRIAAAIALASLSADKQQKVSRD